MYTRTIRKQGGHKDGISKEEIIAKKKEGGKQRMFKKWGGKHREMCPPCFTPFDMLSVMFSQCGGWLV